MFLVCGLLWFNYFVWNGLWFLVVQTCHTLCLYLVNCLYSHFEFVCLMFVSDLFEFVGFGLGGLRCMLCLFRVSFLLISVIA